MSNTYRDLRSRLIAAGIYVPDDLDNKAELEEQEEQKSFKTLPTTIYFERDLSIGYKIKFKLESNGPDYLFSVVSVAGRRKLVCELIELAIEYVEYAPQTIQDVFHSVISSNEYKEWIEKFNNYQKHLNDPLRAVE